MRMAVNPKGGVLVGEAKVQVLSIGLQVVEVASDGGSEFMLVSDLARVIGSDAVTALADADATAEGKRKVLGNMCGAIRDMVLASNKANTKFVEAMCAAVASNGDVNATVMEYRRQAGANSNGVVRLAGMLQRELLARKRAQQVAGRDVQREVQTGATGTGGVVDSKGE